jgi:SAM-dependent methyltransferase
MTRAIGDVTGRPPEEIRGLLWREFLLRGGSVRRAAKQVGATRYVFNDAMIRLYAETDAFLFELALWNVNLMKRSIRRWVASYVTNVLGPRQRVLALGDGLAFDSLALAEAGHDVTWSDLPGFASTFAERMIQASGTGVHMRTDGAALPAEHFDTIVSLDVLEHVPDVEEELRKIHAALRPGGMLIVHAPFYFVHRVAITHLRKNRRYSGSLRLFRRAGFKLFDAKAAWAPLVFVRADGPAPRRPWLAWPRLALAYPVGVILALGRLTALPFEVVNLACRLTQTWYPDDMLGRGAARDASDDADLNPTVQADAAAQT